jgi:hypothetical protein
VLRRYKAWFRVPLLGVAIATAELAGETAQATKQDRDEVDPDRGRKDPNQGPDANYLGRALASSTMYPMDWNVSTYKVQVVPIGQANPAFF